MNPEASILPELWQHRAWLRRFARGLVGDREAADDIVQDTLVAAWQRPPELDRDVRPWLAQVARNRVRDQARAENSRRAREVVASEAATNEGGAPSAEDVLVDDDLHRELAGVVADLDEPFRQTLFQRYYDGLTAAEIARRAAVPAGTVRWRLKEGLDRARRRLDQRHGGDRRTWMRAILPLIPPGALPRTGPSPLLTAAKVFTVVAAAAIVAVGWRVASVTRSAGAIAPAPAAVTAFRGERGQGTQPPTGGASLAAARPTGLTDSLGLAACRQAVLQAHDDLVTMERDLFEWDRDFAFALGGPNPTAEAAMWSFVPVALAREEGRVLEHRFVCRTWACRLAMRKPSGNGTGYGPFWGEDISARAVTVYASSAEEALGLEERPGTFIHLDHIPLRQPSGEPLADGERRFPDPRPRPAAPTTAEGCEALQRNLDKEIDGRLARWLAAEPKEHLFHRSTMRNRELETKVNDRLPWWKTLLTHLECRDDVCYRVPYLGRLPRSWWELTRAEEAALSASAVQTSGVERYLQMTPRKRRR